jgi:hypothetical protein
MCVARRKRSFLAAFCILLFVVTSSAGCAVKFIGDYDLTIDNGVTDVQQRAELYFGKLRAEPRCASPSCRLWSRPSIPR